MARKLFRFWIYWGDNQISCFRLHNRTQAEAIASQYENVTKIENKGLDSWY